MNKALTSAQVVLKQPSTAVYERVKGFFEKAGFTVGPMVANNFSITGPVKKFESHFPTMDSSSEGEPQAGELQLDTLPGDIGESVETILFSRPPDFGPFNP